SCSSLAPSRSNRSKVWSSTQCGRAPGRSILLMTTIGRRPSARALRVTNRVCGIGPSTASTSSSTPSTMESARSTSPPKSAWPGVSTMLMRVPWYSTAQFFARMVIPRSRSMSLESITRSATAWLARKVPDWRRSWSTRVVLPWSTWAMMAQLRIAGRLEVFRIEDMKGGNGEAKAALSLIGALAETDDHCLVRGERGYPRAAEAHLPHPADAVGRREVEPAGRHDQHVQAREQRPRLAPSLVVDQALVDDDSTAFRQCVVRLAQDRHLSGGVPVVQHPADDDHVGAGKRILEEVARTESDPVGEPVVG